MDNNTSNQIVEVLEDIKSNTSNITAVEYKLDEIIELLKQLLDKKES
jgi:hypothetical protein